MKSVKDNIDSDTKHLPHMANPSVRSIIDRAVSKIVYDNIDRNIWVKILVSKQLS